MSVDLRATIGDLVRERPGRSRIFDELQIDYCCGRAVPLAEACAKRGLDPRTVLEQIRQSDERPGPGDEELFDADAMPLTDWTNHLDRRIMLISRWNCRGWMA